MDRRIPLIMSEGTPFERGFHLGDTESERVTQSVVAYMELFKQVAGLSRDDVFASAENFIPVIAHYAPQLLEEIRGIAEGAGRDLREIVAINARTEMMYGVNPRPECTAIGVSTVASADGHIRLAQNWDWHPSLAGTLILWVLRRDDGPDLLTLTEAGIVGKIGINAAGLAMCINLLVSANDSRGPAVPMHILLRHILDTASSVEEAITLIGSTPRCTSCNHLLMDRTGALVSVEATPLGQRIVRSMEGWLTHTNHCISVDLSAHDNYVRERPETLARNRRAQSLAAVSSIAESGLYTILSDHGTAPDSICLHVQLNKSFQEQAESVASIIFDLTTGVVDIADGPPCQYPYRHIVLRDYLRTTSQ